MKAQASIEMLLNFLVFLAVISILLSTLVSFANSAKAHSSMLKEKAGIEMFARTLDSAACMHHFAFKNPGNYSVQGGAIVSAGGRARGYTIYGKGATYGEPI